MKEKKQIRKIKCPIFCSKNETIEKITEAVNNTKDIQSKARFTSDLIREAESLLSCEYFNEKRADCKICRKISEIRKKTAELI